MSVSQRSERAGAHSTEVASQKPANHPVQRRLPPFLPPNCFLWVTIALILLFSSQAPAELLPQGSAAPVQTKGPSPVLHALHTKHIIGHANPSPPRPSSALPRRHHSSSGQGWSPYLVGPDERLHCEMVLHQLVNVGLRLPQEMGLGQCGKAGTQRRGALVSGAWSSSSIGIAEEDVP